MKNIYPEMNQTTEAQIEVKCSYGGGFYLTTDEILTGRGVKLCGDGSDHKRNKRTYQVTAAAMKKIEKSFTTCFISML